MKAAERKSGSSWVSTQCRKLSVRRWPGARVLNSPATSKQLSAIWVDENKAQTPPGSGDLFGIAMTPSGSGFYHVEDESNTLVLAQ